MGKANFTDEFKLDAIKQITERGYSVADVSRRLGVSTHSLYSWMKRYNAPERSTAQDDQLSEIRRLKQELARVTEERDILKKATVDSTCQRNIYFQWLLSQVLNDEKKIHSVRKRNMLVFMEGRSWVQ